MSAGRSTRPACEHRLAGAHVLARVAHVGAGGDRDAHVDVVARLGGVLDPHHRVGAVRHRRAGHDADAPCPARPAALATEPAPTVSSTRRRTGALGARRRDVGAAHRVAVHGRVAERRHVARRLDRLGQHPAARRGQRAPARRPCAAGRRSTRLERVANADHATRRTLREACAVVNGGGLWSAAARRRSVARGAEPGSPATASCRRRKQEQLPHSASGRRPRFPRSTRMLTLPEPQPLMKSRLRLVARPPAPAPVVSAPPLADVLAAFNDAVVVMDRERRIVLFNPGRRGADRPCRCGASSANPCDRGVRRDAAHPRDGGARAAARPERVAQRGAPRAPAPQHRRCASPACRSGTARPRLRHRAGHPRPRAIRRRWRKRRAATRAWRGSAPWSPAWRTRCATRWPASRARRSCSRRGCRGQSRARRVHGGDRPRGQPPHRAGRGSADARRAAEAAAARRSTSTASSSRWCR